MDLVKGIWDRPLWDGAVGVERRSNKVTIKRRLLTDAGVFYRKRCTVQKRHFLSLLSK